MDQPPLSTSILSLSYLDEVIYEVLNVLPTSLAVYLCSDDSLLTNWRAGGIRVTQEIRYGKRRSPYLKHFVHFYRRTMLTLIA